VKTLSPEFWADSRKPSPRICDQRRLLSTCVNGEANIHGDLRAISADPLEKKTWRIAADDGLPADPIPSR
jgi:hypothetical protein